MRKSLKSVLEGELIPKKIHNYNLNMNTEKKIKGFIRYLKNIGKLPKTIFFHQSYCQLLDLITEKDRK